MKTDILKRVVSIAVAASMSASSVLPVFAASNEADEALRAELESDIDLYPDGAFAFYESQLTASEGDGSVYLDIVRRGSAEGEASVSFKAVDVSAVYGKDYTITAEEGFFLSKELDKDTEAVPLIEMMTQSDADVEIGAVTAEDAAADQNIEIAVSEDEGVIGISDDTQTGGSADDTSAEPASGLRAARNIYTGTESDRKSWQDITDSVDEVAPEFAEQTENAQEYMEQFAAQLPGQAYTFNFKDGEYRKRVKINLIDDELSETDEQVMFALYDAENAETTKPFTAYLNIEDNDENEPTVFYMPETEVMVTPDEGYAIVKVARYSGIDKFSSVTVGTGAASAEKDVDYKSGSTEVVFPQGVSERTVKVPIYNAGRTEPVTFVVAIDKDSAYSDENAIKTAVTILPDKDEATIAAYEASRDAAAAAELAGTSVENAVLMSETEENAEAETSDIEESEESTVFTVEDENGEAHLFSTDTKSLNVTNSTPVNYNNSYSGWTTVLSGIDLRNATQVAVTYSVSGNYSYYYETTESYKDGCKTKTRTVTRSDRYTSDSNAQLNIGGKTTTLGQGGGTVNVNFNKANNQTFQLRSQRTNGRGNWGSVNYKISKIVITYQDISINVDNSQVLGTNAYIEKIYQQGGSAGSDQSMRYTTGNTIKLGEGKINNNTNATAQRYSSALTFSITPVNGQKTSQGVVPSEGNNMYLAGWQYVTASNKWSDDIIAPNNMNLETLYSKRGAITSFTVRPVLYPYSTVIRFNNSVPNYLEYTNNITNGKEINVTMLDTVVVNAIGKNNSGYTVNTYAIGGYKDSNIHSSNIATRVSNANYFRNTIAPNSSNRYNYLNGNKNRASSAVNINYNSAEADKITIMPDMDAIYLDMSYTTPKMSVAFNPSSSTPTQYKDQGTVIYSDADKGTLQEGNYSTKMTIQPVVINGEYTLNSVYKDQKSDGTSDYTTVWQDYTGDTNGDGRISATEESQVSAYKLDRGASVGEAFTYSPRLINSSIYYYFRQRQSARTSGIVDGVVMLRDYPIFGNSKVTTTPINEAEVTVDGKKGETAYNKSYGGANGKGGDGYFSFEDKSFVSGESHRVTVRYKNLTTSKVHWTNISQNYILDTYDTIGVTNATKAKKGEIMDDTKPMINDDADYTLTFVTSGSSSIIAQKAVLSFYRRDGSKVTEKEYNASGTNTGVFECTFNPYKLSLPGGTTIKVKFIGNNGVSYYEHDTGIRLTQSLGALSLISSFAGKAKPALEVIGKISSRFSFGWDGDLDDTSKEFSPVDSVKGHFSITNSQEDAGDGSGEMISKRVLNFGLEFSTDGDFGGEDDAKSKEEVKEAAKSGDANKIKEAADSSVDGANKSNSELAAGYELELAFGITLTLKTSVQDGHIGDWYFEELMVSVKAGGGIEVEYEYVTPIGIPILVGFQIGGEAEAVLVVDRKLGTEYYLTNLGDIEQEGSVDLINQGKAKVKDYFYVYGIFRLNPYIGLSAGIGTSSLNIKLNGKAEFEFTFFTNDTPNTGDVTFKASISVKVLFFSKEFEFFNQKVSLFSEGADLHQGLDTFKVSERDYLANRTEWNDSADLFSVASAVGLSESLIMNGVNPNTDTKLLPFGDGNYIAVFTDDVASRTNENSTAAYYTIYKDGTWSKPVILEDDGTEDDTPAIYDLGNGKVFIAWSTANKVFGEEPEMLEVLNSRNIHGVFFDTAAQTFSDVIEVTKNTTEDYTADTDAQIAYDPETNKMLIFYTKSEYEATEGKEGVFGDVVYPYTAMAYRILDLATMEFEDYSDDEKADIIADNELTDEQYTEYQEQWYGQRILDLAPRVIVNETLDEEGYQTGDVTVSEYTGTNDPTVIESASIAYNSLALFAYVLDYDGNKSTTSDRDVFLQYYDFLDNSITHTMMITSNDVEESNLKFVRFGGEHGETYLAYLSGLNTTPNEDGSNEINSGNSIKMFNITHNIANDEVTPEFEAEDGTKYYRLVKTKESGYEPEAVLVSADGIGAYSGEKAITSFDINSGDDYFYTMFTQRSIELKDGVEAGTEESTLSENNLVETQIYMSRYDLNNGTLTAPIQVTDEEGANYANIAFATMDDGFIALATKSMSDVKKIDGTDVSTDNSENSGLYSLEFDPKPVLTVRNATISDIVSGNDAFAEFELYNEGLETIENFKVEIKDNNGNTVNVTYLDNEGEEKTKDTYTLIGGMSETVTFSIPVGEDETGCGFTVTATDSEGQKIADFEYEASVAPQIDVVAFNADITERGIVDYNAVLVNNSLVKSAEGAKFGIKSNDDMLYTEVLPALNAGETIQLNGRLDVDYSKLFTTETAEDGSISAETVLTAVTNTTNAVSANSTLRLYASAEQMARLNSVKDITVADGDDSVSIKTGELLDIGAAYVKGEYKSDRYTDNSEDDAEVFGLDVVYISENNDVVKAYESGYIEGVSKGSATVTAIVMPAGRTADESDYATLPDEALKVYEVEVNVTGKSGSSSSGSSGGASRIGGGSSTVAEATATPAPTATPAATEEPKTTEAPKATEEPKAPKATEKPSKGSSKKTFTDVKASDWFYNAVNTAADKGIVNGMTENTYEPQRELTRAMFVTMLYRYDGEPTANGNVFEDVARGSYYENAVAWAQSNGIVSGYDDTHFGPDDLITREQAVTMMYRYANYKGMSLSDGKAADSFSDYANVSDYAVPSFNWATDAGVINGRSDNTLAPKDNITRAEIAQIFVNFMNI